MERYDERLSKFGVESTIREVILEVIHLEEENITFKSPPRIVQKVMDIISYCIEKKEESIDSDN